MEKTSNYFSEFYNGPVFIWSRRLHINLGSLFYKCHKMSFLSADFDLKVSRERHFCRGTGDSMIKANLCANRLVYTIKS